MLRTVTVDCLINTYMMCGLWTQQ